MQMIAERPSGLIAAMLADGVHPGSRVVSGAAWGDAVVASDLCILDVAGSVDDVRRAVVQSMTSRADAGLLRPYFLLDLTALPMSATNEIAETGRTTITEEELLACVTWHADMDEATMNAMEDFDPALEGE